ncbi:hypothetical protein NP493_13g14024 [Ridgeia piscesae]|uniref:Uncharacterized protein n=1 Tax=Ridgeia piscesae TaxID=27915 RepID=A0AAD9UL23_RIDPI|nr:hypothetical protein NP493_13g14024 [Ridgeia piscesae]
MFGRVVGRLAVLVIACVLNQDSVFGQCKTGHCSGDDGDGGTLATTVSQLQESVEALQQQLTLQEVKLTAQEKSIAFLRNATCCTYEIAITTGTAGDADIDYSEVNVQLYDDDFATEWYHLDNPADDFERGKTDMFELKQKCLIDPCVRLKTVLVSSKPRDWWYCTKVQLKVSFCGSKKERVYDYTFNVGFTDNVESRCPE